MNKKKKVICFISVFAIILLIVALVILYNLSLIDTNINIQNQIDTNVANSDNNIYNQDSIHNFQISKNIEEITDVDEIRAYKEKSHATGNDDIYVIKDYGNGITSLEIKSSINYKVMMAGILKGTQPVENEIEELLQNEPKSNGIWIEKNSRNEILNLVNKVTNNSFEIKSDGYLSLKSNINKDSINKEDVVLNTLIEMINSDKKIIFSVTNKFYELDNINGKIVEYPYERMEPYEIAKTYTDNNNIIYFITTNSENKVNEDDIISYIVNNYKLLK